MKILTTLIAYSCFLIGITNTAQADDTITKKDYYLAPFASYLEPGGDTAGYSGWGAGMGIGRVINADFNVEVRGFWQNYKNSLNCCGGAETDLAGASLDLQYFLSRDTLSPYLVTSFGGMTTDLQSRYFKVSESSFIFEAGAGALYSLSKTVQLRGDIRYRLNTLPSELGAEGVLNDLTINLGFVIPLSQ